VGSGESNRGLMKSVQAQHAYILMHVWMNIHVYAYIDHNTWHTSKWTIEIEA
jgi:hypothetical protein